MRISVAWLKELCPPEVQALSVDEIAQRLTAAGLEIEGREERTLGTSEIVAARVVTRSPIAGSDHLSLCEVDDGAQHYPVVCGAQNYAAGDVVPLARVGAVLPGGLEIKQAKLRGVESNGMLCSARELGLGEDHSGLLHLPHDTRLGTPLSALLGLPDTVLEVNVTPNRPDALSHLGVARELCALLQVEPRVPSPQLPPPTGAGPGKEPAELAAQVHVEDAQRCPRYLARVIEGVKIGPSSLLLQERLRSCGVRSISNAVDATNLALLELGHPLHAFDLDKVAGQRIVVRRAREGEKLTTLDGKERTFTADDLFICDGEKPVAIAGVMGGQKSEVDDGTVRILLESAVFDAAATRRTAKRQALHTEASHRFERGADERTARLALDRCAELIAQLAGGQVVPGVIDFWPHPRPLVHVWVRPARVGAVLGTRVEATEVESRLRSLGLFPVDGNPDRRLWEIPSFRRDLTREIDCIEEVARQRGLDTIPITQHPAGVGTTATRSAEEIATAAARAQLSARGFDEALNYSFVAERDLLALVPRSAPEAVRAAAPRPMRVANPLTVEQGAMRTSLLAGLLRNLQRNFAHGSHDVRLYELGRAYLPRLDAVHGEGKLAWPVAEPRRLALIAHGRAAPRFWAEPKAHAATAEKAEQGGAPGFYELKGALEDLLGALGAAQVQFRPAGEDAPFLHPSEAATLLIAGKPVGAFGRVHPLVAGHFEVPAETQLAELDWDALVSVAQPIAQSRGVPRFPAVSRDLSFVVDAQVPAERLRDEIRAADQKGLLEAVEIFDLYRGAQVAAGKKSVAWSLTLRAPDRTLTDAEADALVGAVVERLRSVVGAEIRA